VHVSFCGFQELVRNVDRGIRGICGEVREPRSFGGRFALDQEDRSGRAGRLLWSGPRGSVGLKRGIHRQDAKIAKRLDQPAHNPLELVLGLIHCELPSRPLRLRGRKLKRHSLVRPHTRHILGKFGHPQKRARYAQYAEYVAGNSDAGKERGAFRFDGARKRTNDGSLPVRTCHHNDVGGGAQRTAHPFVRFVLFVV